MGNRVKKQSAQFLSRRSFNKKVTLGVSTMLLSNSLRAQSKGRIRLGAPVYGTFSDPVEWADAHRAKGYGAAYCPVKYDDPKELKLEYVKAAKEKNLVISEVGAWSNPISINEEERKKALQKNIEALALAEEIGAHCCVNISGSRGELWDGPHKDNLTSETFDLVVETVRKIIDTVKPERTFYTLETMPYTIPDSPDSYLDFINAIDRKQFACHLDVVNMINCPRRYYNNGNFIRDCFKKLGPYIKNCHAKDILLEDKLTVHLNEIRPGLGGLDYAVYLSELAKLPDSIGLMIEHLSTAEDYDLAADYIRSVGKKQGLEFI